ncbi:ribonuclease P protein component [Aeromicrobium sp. Root495]|uniref:ribonuclease P protein component n=1 Tax=Aeromicrobium sp. Root495 TaxID=1736550 RepID=UPI000AD2E2AC|nr:ribonuclease P protein component [Aeromicrobium sp. Root495]
MRDSQDFALAVRRGTKAAQPTLVCHVVPGTGGLTSVGFVVSKQVGPAVVRSQVKRRLRHLMRDRLDLVPPGSRVVVRALPASSGADSSTLAEHLDVALVKAGSRSRTRSDA